MTNSDATPQTPLGFIRGGRDPFREFPGLKALCVAQFTCPGDGNYPATANCKMYYGCTAGIAQQRYCEGETLVFNTNVNRCTHYSQAPAPCNLFVNCRGVVPGVYPHMPTDCRHYYTCQRRGIFMGAIACTPGTVFDARPSIMTCNWPEDTPPPCGTLNIG